MNDLNFVHLKLSVDEFVAFVSFLRKATIEFSMNIKSRQLTTTTESLVLYDYLTSSITNSLFTNWLYRDSSRRYRFKIRLGYAMVIYEALKKEDLTGYHDLNFFAGQLQHRLFERFEHTRIAPIMIGK